MNNSETLGNLAMDAMDRLRELYGEGAEIADALLLIEVAVPDEQEPGGMRLEMIAKCTTYRATVADGLAHLYLETTSLISTDEPDEDYEEPV